jgi:cell division protein FtsZ
MDEMNDVHEFMSKFSSDFEIKWGMAIDPELGKKVKVTILATGFGIEDVDGMNAHLGKKYTQEEANRIAEEEEKRVIREDRRKRYYNDDPNHSQKKRRKHIFLFGMEDLDNEDVILAVENTPTYKRTRQMLEEISNQASGNSPKKDKDESENVQPGIIKF